VEGGIATLFPWVFARGERILDVGAGSGRDLARLLDLGMDACGLEPVDVLRAEAIRLHPELEGRLLAGSIPGELPAGLPSGFDGIVCSAVLMPVPHAELFNAAYCLRGWLREGGRLRVSVPTARGDVEQGVGDRDRHGRLIILQPAERLRLFFERLGFASEGEWHSADSLGRPDVQWVVLLVRLRGGAPRPIDRIDSIINRDHKTATYKLALLRALCDIALTAYPLARWETDGSISIPLSEIAMRWVLYYWPIVDAAELLIPQTAGEYEGACLPL
jgi:SAM-dependent methyltransferase